VVYGLFHVMLRTYAYTPAQCMSTSTSLLLLRCPSILTLAAHLLLSWCWHIDEVVAVGMDGGLCHALELYIVVSIQFGEWISCVNTQ
jgi:hypothetical protein